MSKIRKEDKILSEKKLREKEVKDLLKGIEKYYPRPK